MKAKSYFFITLLMIISLIIVSDVCAQTVQKDSKTGKSKKSRKAGIVRLFNGKDLSNWVFHLKDPAVDPATVFTVKDKVINVKGDPFGYMRTIDRFSDYRLHVEWRWPVEATNSGVFVHAQTPDNIWIKSIECQLAAGKAGDFICMNGTDMNERIDKSSIVVNKMAPSSEKPVGEWNTMEVICKANTLEVYVNGILQNRGTGVSVSEGHICLQSEGKDIQFRNVYVSRLNK